MTGFGKRSRSPWPHDPLRRGLPDLRPGAARSPLSAAFWGTADSASAAQGVGGVNAAP